MISSQNQFYIDGKYNVGKNKIHQNFWELMTTQVNCAYF